MVKVGQQVGNYTNFILIPLPWNELRFIKEAKLYQTHLNNMQQEIYKSDRYFTLFDMMISHGQLLLRSQKDDINKTNIDIIFFGTSYIQTYSGFNSICVRKMEHTSNFINYKTVNTFLGYKNHHLFEIESNNEKYFIAASFVKVFENQLDFNETSLGMNYKGRENEIASSL